MVMACKVARMTIDTSAAVAAINRGVTIAVGAYDPGAISTGVTEEATIVVDSADCIAGVTTNTERCRGHSRGVVMSMAGGEEAGTVAAYAR